MATINPPEKTSPIRPIDSHQTRDNLAKRGAPPNKPRPRPNEQDLPDRADGEPPGVDEFV